MAETMEKCDLCASEAIMRLGDMPLCGKHAPAFPSPNARPITSPKPASPIAPPLERETDWTMPKGPFPGVMDYERERIAGQVIREAVDHDAEKMRFYLTCSVGELAQRVVVALVAPRVETEGDAAREKLRKAIRFEWSRRESDSWAWALIEEAFGLIPPPRPSGWYHEADEKLYEATMSEPPSIPLVANAAIPPGEVHVKVDGKTVAKIVGLDLSSRPPVDPKEGT